jgi:hypothetical protein
MSDLNDCRMAMAYVTDIIDTIQVLSTIFIIQILTFSLDNLQMLIIGQRE